MMPSPTSVRSTSPTLASVKGRGAIGASSRGSGCSYQRDGRDLCFTYAEAVDVRQLATFRTIVETGNFARAAGRLGIGASTVTLHIQQLEAELGGPLFVRQCRRLDLTELGSSLPRPADALAGHLDAIGEEA